MSSDPISKMDKSRVDNSMRRADLQKLVDEHLASGDYESAVFWAEKIVSMSPGKSVNDRLPELAQHLATLTAAGKWIPIITFISKSDLILVHMVFTYYYVHALYRAGRHSEIITIPIGHLHQWDDVPFITPDAGTKMFASRNQIRDERTRKTLDELAAERKIKARLLYTLARTYLMVQNRPAARGCIRHCLSVDPFASDVVYLALELRLMDLSEIRAIIAPAAALNPSGHEVIRMILDLHDPEQIQNDSVPFIESQDISVQSAVALRLYEQGDVQEAYKITSAIIHDYGYHDRCFLLHIGCLVELKHVYQLYELGHKLVKMQPEREVTWYAVGCYYFATGQYATAKKFLNKCTQVNAGFGEGWLAFGHALFHAEEHEQAMNCYLRASRILEGHFEPLLYIAVEYCFANNFKFANDFLHDAEQISGLNPIVLHEQATTAFMREDYAAAEKLYCRALNLMTTKYPDAEEIPSLQEMLIHRTSEFWEPIYRNLAHTLRHLKKYEDAIDVYRKSLLILDNKLEAWGGIGLCYASMGDLNKAIDALNTALTFKPSDDHLRSALEKVMNHSAKLPISDTIVEKAEENIGTLKSISADRKRQSKKSLKST